ncbi:membrane dipeptidase [Tropicibacter sp. R16_0]|uniref:membrane dipeptidase n=1 Tax=Tropicibacter sp. R16_0 TaxID=2821102 RepID=UPI001ADD5AB4|nr:membrane dipeptidase [Tropicibacter sp. R16_0]MBO9448750.1 membrane dipeptidase [Tropicibacter sp. R16_0]
MTLAAADMSFETLLERDYHFRSVMGEQPQNFLVVNQTRDIEAAHAQGNTAVIWNNQTATILNDDLKKMALPKDMGIKSMILAYIDILRTGSGQLAAYNGNYIGLTPWGRSVVDEMVRFGILLDLSHTESKTANDAMDDMDARNPGRPYVYIHSVPAGLYKSEPGATPRGCYRAIPDDEALRAAKSGGYNSPTFTEWMMDGISPEDISAKQAADMIDAFNKGATGNCELAKILAAITDDLWARGYSNEDLTKIFGGNKMRVYAQVWEDKPPEWFLQEFPRTPASATRVSRSVLFSVRPRAFVQVRRGCSRLSLMPLAGHRLPLGRASLRSAVGNPLQSKRLQHQTSNRPQSGPRRAQRGARPKSVSGADAVRSARARERTPCPAELL